MERDLSKPHRVQALERFLDVTRLLTEVEDVMMDPIPSFRYSWNVENGEQLSPDTFTINRDCKPEEKFIYDTSELTEENMWLRDILLSDSSDSSDEEEMTDELMKRMLKKHKQMKKIREKTRHQPISYSGYSSSILASDSPASHFDFPSLDYSNKTRREKRPLVRKRKSEEVEPLTIADMIDALAPQVVDEERCATPPQLLIDSAGPCLKKPKCSRSTGQIWREAIGHVIIRAKERCTRITEQRKSRKKIKEALIESEFSRRLLQDWCISPPDSPATTIKLESSEESCSSLSTPSTEPSPAPVTESSPAPITESSLAQVTEQAYPCKDPEDGETSGPLGEVKPEVAQELVPTEVHPVMDQLPEVKIEPGIEQETEEKSGVVSETPGLGQVISIKLESGNESVECSSVNPSDTELLPSPTPSDQADQKNPENDQSV